MADDKRIVSCLKGYLYGSLATINADNPKQPHVSSVVYVNDGLDLYFGTSAKSQKFINLIKNPKVAFTIDEYAADWRELKGLQIEGEAEVVKEDRVPFVYGIYSEKFPIIKSLPDNTDSRFVKITPQKIWMLDYSKGFGHRDYLEL